MNIYRELHDEVFKILLEKLPVYLTYHTPEHTAYVLDRAEFIAGKENVNGQDLFLIKLGALFHDIGFIEQNINHEQKGCEICTDMLNQYQFKQEDIEKICGIIMATQIPQQPLNLNERIVADADLEYLGTDLFYPVSQHLYHEFRHFYPGLGLDKFNEIQVEFISHHKYHTDYCIQHLEEKKQENLREILSGYTREGAGF